MTLRLFLYFFGNFNYQDSKKKNMSMLRLVEKYNLKTSDWTNLLLRNVGRSISETSNLNGLNGINEEN
jgi:hypothetical protein